MYKFHIVGDNCNLYTHTFQMSTSVFSCTQTIEYSNPAAEQLSKVHLVCKAVYIQKVGGYLNYS